MNSIRNKWCRCPNAGRSGSAAAAVRLTFDLIFANGCPVSVQVTVVAPATCTCLTGTCRWRPQRLCSRTQILRGCPVAVRGGRGGFGGTSS